MQRAGIVLVDRKLDGPGRVVSGLHLEHKCTFNDIRRDKPHGNGTVRVIVEHVTSYDMTSRFAPIVGRTILGDLQLETVARP